MGLRPLQKDSRGVSRPRPVNEHEKGRLKKEQQKADWKKRNRK